MTKSPNTVKVCHSNTVEGNKEGASRCGEVVVSLAAMRVKMEHLKTPQLGFGSQPRCLVRLTMTSLTFPDLLIHTKPPLTDARGGPLTEVTKDGAAVGMKPPRAAQLIINSCPFFCKLEAVVSRK